MPDAPRAWISIFGLVRIQRGIVLGAFEFLVAIWTLENILHLTESGCTASRWPRCRPTGRSGNCSANPRCIQRLDHAQLYGVAWGESLLCRACTDNAVHPIRTILSILAPHRIQQEIPRLRAPQGIRFDGPGPTPPPFVLVIQLHTEMIGCGKSND